MDKCFDLVLGDQREHIARISYGKDSLKMLNVINSRGLRLDRITTTDVWATDTIPAWLPPMDSFKARMDEWIWRNYRIEVEHLCARNKDGSKKTYEQMFYHIPVRRSKNVQVEREREREETNRDRIDSRIPRSVEPLVSEAQNKSGDHKVFLFKFPIGAKSSRSTMSELPFLIARHDGQKEISWNILVSQQMNRTVSAN